MEIGSCFQNSTSESDQVIAQWLTAPSTEQLSCSIFNFLLRRRVGEIAILVQHGPADKAQAYRVIVQWKEEKNIYFYMTWQIVIS